MQNLEYQGKSVFNPLQGKMSDIRDSFVAIYGEQYRYKITEKLKNVHIFHSFALARNSRFEHTKILHNLKSQFVKANQELDWVQVRNLIDSLDMEEKTPQMHAIKEICEEEIAKREVGVSQSANNEPFLKEQLDEILQQPLIQQISTEYILTNPMVRTPEKDKILESLDQYTNNMSQFEKEVVQESAKAYLYNGPSRTRAYATFALNQETKQLETFVFLPNVIDLTTNDGVHELGHVIDFILLQTYEEKYIHKGGFELGIHDSETGECRDIKIDKYGDITKIKSKGRRRPYELLNEVAHDKISEIVAEHYENSTGDKLGFGDKIETLYSLNFPIFSQFVETDLDAIIECKMAEDMNRTAGEYFGYENLNRLAEINEAFSRKRCMVVENDRIINNVFPEGGGLKDKIQSLNNGRLERLTDKAKGAVDSIGLSVREGRVGQTISSSQAPQTNKN